MRSSGERLLLVDTYGGLGNRVKPVLSGARFAALSGRRLVYRWNRDRLFRAVPTDLWTDFPVRAGQLEFLRDRSGSTPVEDPTTVARFADAERILVRHHDPLEGEDAVTPWRSDLRRLQPVPEVVGRTIEVLGRLADRPLRIGVMVRAHRRASDETKQTSPPVWFTQRIRDVRAAFGDDAAIYLSCDNPAVQASVEAEFSGLISTAKHGYNSKVGVQDALVDLYGLGACDLIVGPDGSTFVHLADYLGDGVAQVVTPSGRTFEKQLERLHGGVEHPAPYPWLEQRPART